MSTGNGMHVDINPECLHHIVDAQVSGLFVVVRTYDNWAKPICAELAKTDVADHVGTFFPGFNTMLLIANDTKVARDVSEAINAAKATYKEALRADALPIVSPISDVSR